MLGREEKELEKENQKLRQSFKDLNKQLQDELEKVKVVDFPGKKVEFRDKSPEDKAKTIDREMINNEKILAINQEEYRKCQARFEVVKDLNYVSNIQKKIDDIKKQIIEIKKTNKQVELTNNNAGKNLDNIENVKGVPGNIENAMDKEKEVLKFRQKLEAVKAKNAALMEQKEQNMDRIRKLNEDQKRLQNGIPGYTAPNSKDETIAKKRETCLKQIKALQEGIKVAEHNNKKFLANNVEKDIEDLLMTNLKQVEHLEKLEGIIKEQSNALQEMMDDQIARDMKSSRDLANSDNFDDDEHRGRTNSAELPAAALRTKDKAMTQSKDLGAGTDNMYMGLPLYSPNMQKIVPGSTKGRLAVKRDLEAQRRGPKWKETEYQISEKVMPVTKIQNSQKDMDEMNKMYSKPMGFSKVDKFKDTDRGSPAVLKSPGELPSANKFENKLRNSAELKDNSPKPVNAQSIKAPAKQVIKVDDELEIDEDIEPEPVKAKKAVEKRKNSDSDLDEDKKLIPIKGRKSPEAKKDDESDEDKKLIPIKGIKSPEKKEEPLAMPLPPIGKGLKLPDDSAPKFITEPQIKTNPMNASPAKLTLEQKPKENLNPLSLPKKREESSPMMLKEDSDRVPEVKVQPKQKVNIKNNDNEVYEDVFDGDFDDDAPKKQEAVFSTKPKKQEEQKKPRANIDDDDDEIPSMPSNKPKVVSKPVETKKPAKNEYDDEFDPIEDYNEEPKPKPTNIGNNRLNLNKPAAIPKVTLLGED